ncbi:MAG: hypothetical protein JXA72_03445 [Bacteroidales bacterium]|nr:hypothetical protein [Bacteroidales bacterium]
MIIGEKQLLAQQIPVNDQGFHKAVKLETGIFKYASVDEIYTNQIYPGTGFITTIGFENRRRVLSSTTMGFSLLKRYPDGNKNNEYPLEADNRLRVIKHLHFEASSFHCFHLFTIRKSLPIYAALNWFTTADLVTNYGMTPELLLSTMAPGIYSEYVWRRHLVSFSFTTSVLSYTCRSNYSNVIAQDFEKYEKWDFIRSNSRIQGINSFRSVFLNLLYTYQLSDKFCMNASYNFRYINDAIPRNLRLVTGIYQLGLTYKFQQY